MGEPSNALTHRHHALDRLDDPPASTAPVSFDGTVVAWPELPVATRKLARRPDPVLAERVVSDGGLYESPSGLVQVLRAWRAHPGAVLVAVVQRPVTVDGQALRSRGPWVHVSLRSYEASTTPRRRVGVVPAGEVVDHGSGPGARPSAPNEAAAHDAWSFLPSVVRQSAQKAVPVVDDWIGDLRQAHEAGVPASQDIAVLRRSASAAVVVTARRTAPELAGATTTEISERLAHEPWSVEQITYDLREPVLLGSAPAVGLPWS